MKTREEVESLKNNWKYDPCWNIEETEGFEDYKDELKSYRLRIEQECEEKAKNEKEEIKRSLFKDENGNYDIDKIAGQILELKNIIKYEIKNLDKRIDFLENRT